jgi:hypothetical protein
MPGFDSYTKLLIHFDGTDAANTYTAETGQTVSFSGNAQLDTAQKKFGSASLLLDGTTDFVTIPDNDNWFFDAGNFTIDFWVRPHDIATAQQFFTQFTDANNRQIFYLNGASLGYKFILGGVDKASFGAAHGFTADTWYHIAIVRNGNRYDMYKNGTSIANVTDATAFPDFTGTFNIGANPSGTESLNGWIDEFRISKGIARWTGNFTVPTTKYSRMQTSVLLNLIHFKNN